MARWQDIFQYKVGDDERALTTNGSNVSTTCADAKIIFIVQEQGRIQGMEQMTSHPPFWANT